MLIYVVQPGDTLNSIARQYGVSVSRLLSDNGLKVNQRLVVGQALLLVFPGITYTVKPGDTLISIATQNNISVSELLQNNPTLILNPVLQPDRKLIITFSTPKQRSLKVNGYAYSFIDEALLRRTLPYLTYLSVFSYGFNAQGELIPTDDEKMIKLAYEYDVAPLMVLTTIDENGKFSSQKVSRLVNDTAYQEKVLTNVIETMKYKGYVGLDVDFEFIPPQDAEAFIDFLSRAKAKLEAEGFILSVAVAPKNSADQAGLLYESHNYPAIAAYADFVFLMTYEWGFAYGPPLAVAPINQVRRVVEYAVTEMSPEEILLGVPNYGYDWYLPFQRGGERAVTIGNEEAVGIAARTKAEIAFDETAKSPFFYYSQNGRNHVVWFEDARSVEATFQLADEFGLAGIGYWNLMRPFAQNWTLLAVRYYIEKVV